jgi:hypothetical protein
MADETETKAEPTPETKPESDPKPQAPETKAAPSEPPAEGESAARADDTKADDTKSDAADEPKTSVQQSDDDGAVLDAKGRERPRFLLQFPEHPELARLVTAFEAGNYALVREEAEALAERAESPAVRDAALELRRRIEPDPLVKYLLALTAALLLFLAYFAYNH